MVETTAIVSSVVMGVFLLVVAAALSRNRSRSVFATTDDESTWAEALLADLTERSQDPLMWTLSFFLLTVGLGASVLLYVGGGPVSDANQAAAGVVIAGLFALVICGFLFFGAYITAKSKGRSTAWGVAEGVIALGLVFMAAIMTNLIVS
jgi:VIT1/CCC1 family predicted Fe2+/Mn2+ transporter